jgi:hypothetical protein
MNIRIFCPPVDLHLAKEIQLWLTRPWPGSLRQQPPSLTHSLTPSFVHAPVDLSKENAPLIQDVVAIYGPMIYMAPDVMLLMRANPLRGEEGD